MKIHYKNNICTTNENETVLDCLLRNNLNTPYSCKSGICQSCMMQAKSGKIPEKSQEGLKTNLKKRDLFLACQCLPSEDIEISDPDDSQINIKSSIKEITPLNHNVLRVRITPNNRFECEPGQYLNLINSHQVSRSYSIANNPNEDGFIELHVKIIENGAIGTWLKNEAKIGSEVIIRGAYGNCFYSNEEGNNHKIILAGTGTGLAPLFGITNEAIKQKHKGDITLIHGVLEERDLYLTKELKNVESNVKNFDYIPCVANGEKSGNHIIGNIEEITMDKLKQDTENTYLFICGAPKIVNSLKTKAFLSGLPSKNIFTDAFIPSK